MRKVVTVDTVLAHEPLENVETLGSQDVDTTLLEEVGTRIRRVLNQSCVHKLLAHRLGHITGHGEGGRSRGRNDAGRLSWIWSTIGLGELEGRQIPRCIISAWLP